jgi:molybdenum cofactor biosynthesis protein B
LTRPGHPHHAAPVRAGVALLTVSDTRTAETDQSGATARRLLEAAGHRVVDYRILPDEPAGIAEQVRGWVARDDCDVVIVNGGTGISPRDRTPDALAALMERRLDGVAGIVSGCPVFCLPGSSAAVTLGLEMLILPELAHLLAELRKGR